MMDANPTTLLARLRGDDRGAGLVLVLALSLVFAAMTTTALHAVASSQRQVDKDQHWHAAMTAAEAGMDDYLYRLNRNDSYWRHNTTAASPDANPALSGWTPVPGGTGRGEFRYNVDTSRMAQTGTAVLNVRGRSGGTERQLQVGFRRVGFLDFIYFSDFETLDPTAYPTAEQRSTAETNCRRYLWAGRTNSTSGAPCVGIVFATGEVVHGPFHTNDRLTIQGSPTFNGPTSSSATGALYTGTGTPNFPAGPMFYRPVQQMPPSNAAIKAETDHTIGKEGCLYTGPTEIRIRDDRLLIRSPYTKQTGPGCGSFPAVSPNNVQVNIPIPANGVVYVQNIPASGPNRHTTACTPGNNGLGYPIAGDVTTYSCRDGDAFVEGTLDGRLTIGTENNLNIIWHILRRDSSTTSDDILGLVADRFVQIYHPVTSSSTTNSQTTNLQVPRPSGGTAFFSDPTVEAAILSVNHSFIVQNFRQGARLGTLTVNGSIAQRFRGPVGLVGTSGYDKAYYYDSRFQYLSPPHFIDPVAAAWRVSGWSER